MRSRDNLEQFFTDIDKLIRDGQVPEARNQLMVLPLKTVPGALRGHLGQLLVRVNLPHKAISALISRVRSGPLIRPSASRDELLTYAMALIRFGQMVEAEEILASLPETVAEVHLYQAYIRQSQWDYGAAAPLIERYLELKDATPYERSVARINLLACLIQAERFDDSQSVYDKLAADIAENNWQLLEKNLHELSAQLAIGQMQWARARTLLKEAKSTQEPQSIADLFAHKWLAAADVYEKGSPESLAQLRLVRDAGIRLGHWETVRDCDRITAEALQDQSLFNLVYMGTPHVSFREKMLRSCPWANRPESVVLGSAGGQVLDLATASLDGNDCGLKPGQNLHRALRLLLSDFYRPTSIGKFFSEMFAGEYFDPESSFNRVGNVMYRLRNWQRSQRLPIEVECERLNYRILIQSPEFGILVRDLSAVGQVQVSEKLAVDGSLGRIRSRLPYGTFTAREAADVLKLSKSSAVRLLNRAVSNGLLSKTGSSRATIYKWKESPQA